MSNHDHNHSHSSNPLHVHHHGTAGLKTAFFLNIFFTIVEIVGGLLTNSVAILSDAIHDLGDSFTLLFAWYMERISTKKSTPQLTFGYKRFSLLGALASSLVLLLGSIYILSEAIPRLFHPETVHPEGMTLLAITGVVINGLAVLRLKGGAKLNQRSVMLHLLEDVLGWIAVLIVSLILLFFDLPILDPLLSIVITVFVLSRIYPNMKSALKIFLQYIPEDMDIQVIKTRINSHPKVSDVHDIHLWSIDGVYTIFSAHVALLEDASLSAVETLKRELKEILLELGIEHATLEMEAPGSPCVECDMYQD
jgi:cobalt-zinc-cadmium efflux system protein